MQNNPNDSINTMTVDIRLCGNIPRNEMKAHFGAPYPTTASTSQSDYLSTACLAAANGPTLRKLNNSSDEALDGLTIQKTINMLNVLSSEKQLPLTPVLEPPSWAVPARVETRLEVSVMMIVLVILFECFIFNGYLFFLMLLACMRIDGSSNLH